MAVPRELAARLGENVVRHRERAGISQEELGIRAELHRTEVSQLERGLRVARVDTLLKLAAALEASPADLLEGMTWRCGERRLGGFSVSHNTEN